MNPIFKEIRNLIINSRGRIYTTVNIEMLNLYWNIGKIIMNIQNLKQSSNYGDLFLEKNILKHLRQFLLELGKGFMFVGSQVRITLEEDHFYPDLVFYNRIAKCFVKNK